MSGIDLWDDDVGDAASSEPSALSVLLLASPQLASTWSKDLDAYGIELTDDASQPYELVLVEEAWPHAMAQLGESFTVANEDRPPFLFLLNEADEAQCLRAFAAGADEYVHLPISAAAFAARLRRSAQTLREQKTLKVQLDESSRIAFQAMSLNAELGRILQFMESSFACQTFETVAQLALSALAEFGLHCSLGIFHPGGLEYFYDDGLERTIEREVVEIARNQGRIADFGPRTIVNYPHVGLLVRNMPLHDPIRYGVIKDHICFVANALDARVAAMLTERAAKDRAVRIQATAAVLQQMIAEMEDAKLQLTRVSTQELEGMLDNLHVEFSQLCLTAPEEDRLMRLLTESSERINHLFKSTAEQDKAFQTLLKQVASTLER